MNDIKNVITPEWGGEPYLRDYWSILSQSEKNQVLSRLDDLFAEGLPIDLVNDRIIYAQIFSLLAFVEIAGLRVTYNLNQECANKPNKQRMQEHFVDEVVHALIFAKLAYQLSLPYGMPPAFDEEPNNLCDFLGSQEEAAIGLLLGFIVGEGFVEAIFSSLRHHGFAPKVLDLIIQDEQKHLLDNAMYQDFGQPNKKQLAHQLELFEEVLIATFLRQDQCVLAFNSVLGSQGCIELIDQIQSRYTVNLEPFGLKPGKRFLSTLDLGRKLAGNRTDQRINQTVVPLSSARKVMMSVWKEPIDPTMTATFSINCTPIGFFENTHPKELINTLMLQALSLLFFENPAFRQRLSMNQLVQTDNLAMGLAVKLPKCGNQVGAITFENAHLMDVRALSECIKLGIERMTYCYEKCQEIRETHPDIPKFLDDKLYAMRNAVFPTIRLGPPFVSLSNVSHWGYENVKSPLFPGEAVKFTLGAIERKQVWNNNLKQFEIQDVLPVSLSADHRVFDGNLHIPKIIATNFAVFFDNYIKNQEKPYVKNHEIPTLEHFKRASTVLLNTHFELGCHLLFASTFIMDGKGTLPS
ncbi:MAG: 2-oxo acid dehydrogenase subunit E2 [Legionellales bacterium]